MKIYFIRNTHNPDGSFRKELEDKPTTYLTGLGVHGLNKSGERTTLDEFIKCHYDYVNDNPEPDFNGGYYPNTITVSKLLKDLSDLIEDDLVKVEIDNGN